MYYIYILYTNFSDYSLYFTHMNRISYITGSEVMGHL